MGRLVGMAKPKIKNLMGLLDPEPLKISPQALGLLLLLSGSPGPNHYLVFKLKIIVTHPGSERPRVGPGDPKSVPYS
jgi:hypothetical protein